MPPRRWCGPVQERDQAFLASPPSTLRRDLRVCERTGELLEAFYPQTAPVPFLDRQTSRNLKCIQRRRSTTATARLKAVTPASPGSGERDSGSARRPRSNQICPLSGAKRTCSGRKRTFPFPMSAFGGKADVLRGKADIAIFMSAFGGKADIRRDASISPFGGRWRSST